MRTITALTVQKKNNDRVNVFLDGEFAFGLPYGEAVQLKVGQLLTLKEIRTLQQADLLDKAKGSAIGLISRRPRSIVEVERHLIRKGYDEQLVEKVIERLQQLELLDDVSFSQYWIEQRETFKPRSKMALRQELRQKGVSTTIIEAAIDNINETAAARRAVDKKIRLWGDLPQKEFRLKINNYLRRLGFPYDIINQISNEFWHALVENPNQDDAVNF